MVINLKVSELYPIDIISIFSFAGNECRKIMRHLENLEGKLPEVYKLYLTAFYALRNLNLMANMVRCNNHSINTPFLLPLT